MSCHKNSENINTNDTIEHIVISGKPYERGLSYGQRLKVKISKNIAYYRGKYCALDWVKVHEHINRVYVPAIENYYPSGMVELRGIATGAGVALEDVIALNANYELNYWNKAMLKSAKGGADAYQPAIGDENNNECSSAVCLAEATRAGHVLLGMNSDEHEFFHHERMTLMLEVRPHREENIAPFIMFAKPGCMGRIGMNANGLGIVGLNVSSSDVHLGADGAGTGYVPISLLRRMFIESPTLAVALKRLLSAPRHTSNNIIVASGKNEALNIEMTANQYFITYPALDTHFLTHTNTFKSQGFMADLTVRDSMLGLDLIRDRQLQHDLYARCVSGTLDTEAFAQAFKNHVTWPESVCAHVPPDDQLHLKAVPLQFQTISNVIMNLTEKSVRVCRGQPCLATYTEFTL